MPKIYITGVSGTGKTTLAGILKSRGFHTIGLDETENLCHWVHKGSGNIIKEDVVLDKKFIDTHDWICDAGYLKELIEKSKGTVVAFGAASNQNEFLAIFDTVLLLRCKPETFIKRIEERKDNIFGKEKTAQESILGWYEYFENELLKKGAIPIDAERLIEEVVAQVISEINPQ